MSQPNPQAELAEQFEEYFQRRLKGATKAYAIINKRGKIIADLVYRTKGDAQYYLKNFSYEGETIKKVSIIIED